MPSPSSSYQKTNGKKKKKPTKRYHDYDDPLLSAHLSWRLDPQESLSDWTIVVASSENAGEQPVGNTEQQADHDQMNTSSPLSTTSAKHYYVHKAVLGVGPRKSDFFSKIFHQYHSKNFSTINGDNDSENNNGAMEPVTHLEMKPSAAAAFDAMLDFVYGSHPDTQIEACTESAVALRHLSIALGIRELFQSVTPFIQKDLTPLTSPTYVYEAHLYKHDKLLNVAMKLCANNLGDIKLSSLIILTPSLLTRVLHHPTHFRCDSEILSTRVASYFRCRPAAVSKNNLLNLTHPKIMPRVAPDEVLFFLRLLEQTGLLSSFISGDATNQEDIAANTSKRLISPTTMKPTLFDRCVAASTDAVRTVMEGKLQFQRSLRSAEGGDSASPRRRSRHGRRLERQILKTNDSEYESLSTKVRVRLLETALVANLSHEEASSRRESRGEDDQQSPSPRRGSGRHSVGRAEEPLLRQIKALEDRVAVRDETIRRYQAEMDKFTRVPNDYFPPDNLAAYTYEGGEERTSEKYGLIPPTSLPRLKPPQSNGWIFREDRVVSNRSTDEEGEGEETTTYQLFWPMYYYKAT